ncbi:hypothetical protein APED_14030 [Acanthopleuribacter pedis]
MIVSLREPTRFGPSPIHGSRRAVMENRLKHCKRTDALATGHKKSGLFLPIIGTTRERREYRGVMLLS